MTSEEVNKLISAFMANLADGSPEIKDFTVGLAKTLGAAAHTMSLSDIPSEQQAAVLVTALGTVSVVMPQLKPHINGMMLKVLVADAGATLQ